MKNRDEQRFTASVIYEMEIDLAAVMNTVMRIFSGKADDGKGNLNDK